MYVPPHFSVDEEQAGRMLAAARLGVLVTSGPSGLVGTHMPFVFDASRRILCGHMARGNPQPQAGEGDGLVIFQGPDAYVSPGFYASKAEHGRVVPTWNYEAVHVHGRVRFIEDRAWLKDNVAQLSQRFEAARRPPWSLADAPADYVERLLGGIVGVELAIGRIEAKRKLSQNRPAADKAGVIEGLEAGALPGEAEIAALMRALEEG